MSDFEVYITIKKITKSNRYINFIFQKIKRQLFDLSNSKIYT